MQFLDLFDDQRQRAVPVAHYPAQGKPLGWLLFSVGFGGGREGYGFLGRAWSQSGFDVAVIEHVGSNLPVLKSLQFPGMRQHQLAEAVSLKVREPEELLARPSDLQFVRQRLCPQASWVGLAGHSFGSYTCLAALGLEVQMPQGPRRLGSGSSWQGAFLMSVQPPREAVEPISSGLSLFDRRSFAEIDIPVMMMTGTRDSGLPSGVDYQQRLESFRALRGGKHVSAVLRGADHMSFAGVGIAVEPVVRTVSRLSQAFWGGVRAGRPPEWPGELELEVDFENA